MWLEWVVVGVGGVAVLFLFGGGGVDVIWVGGIAVLTMLLLCRAIAVWGRGGGCDWGGWWVVVGGGGVAWSLKWPANSVFFYFHHQIEIKIIRNHFSATLSF